MSSGLRCLGWAVRVRSPHSSELCDFARARPDRLALMLAIEISSESYDLDDSLKPVVGKVICAEGTAAFLLSTKPSAEACYPEGVDFGSFLDLSISTKWDFSSAKANRASSSRAPCRTWWRR